MHPELAVRLGVRTQESRSLNLDTAERVAAQGQPAKVRKLAALVCAAALVEAEAQRLVAAPCKQVGRLI